MAENFLQGKDDLENLVFDSLNEGVLIVDPHMNIVYVNQAIGEIFGYSKDEILRQHITMLIPFDKRERHNQLTNDFVKNPHSRPSYTGPHKREMGSSREITGLCRNGQEIPLDISLSPIRTKGTNYTVALISDITDRKKWERQLLQKNQDLELFGSSVAHDLKNLVNKIHSISFLMDPARVNNLMSQGEMARELNETSLQMFSTIDSLLLLSQLSYQETTLEELKLSEVIQSCEERFKDELEKHKITIFYHGAAHFPSNFAWLVELFANLVSNTIKYSQGKAQIIRIESIPGPEGSMTIRYQDQGPGMDPDKISQILGNQNALVSRTSTKGFGLGYQIIKKIIKNLGGTMGIENGPSEGLMVTMHFPSNLSS